MEKYSLTSLKQIGNSDKKMRNNGAIILINRKNFGNENENIRKNKSFNKPIKYNILINKQRTINDGKNNTKYYLSEIKKSETKGNNNYLDNINMAKSQKIFFIKRKNEENKSRQQKYRYQISNNIFHIINNKVNINNNNENDKISVNKSNEFIVRRKSSKPQLINIQKILYIQKDVHGFLRTQKINLNNIYNNKISKKQNFENKINNLKKESPSIRKRPHSIKYNHFKIKRNINKVNELFELNSMNLSEKIGEQINKYSIGKTLGKGAYAIVKLVTDKETKIDYAMKIYKKSEIKNSVRKKCVNNEIEILKKINHKNIIKLIEVIDLKNYILIIQELFLGISLGKYHKKYWKTEELTKKKEKTYKIILTQIFSAINYLHLNGIAHLDIKMDNILINDKLDIKIIDFGFAVYDPKKTLNQFFGGTPNYMSPEIILKRPYISILSDIWSLGVLVFELFCNEYPFKGFTEKDLYNSIKKGKYRIKCFVHYDIKKIINSMLILEPNKRATCDKLLKLPWFCSDKK